MPLLAAIFTPHVVTAIPVNKTVPATLDLVFGELFARHTSELSTQPLDEKQSGKETASTEFAETGKSSSALSGKQGNVGSVLLPASQSTEQESTIIKDQEPTIKESASLSLVEKSLAGKAEGAQTVNPPVGAPVSPPLSSDRHEAPSRAVHDKEASAAAGSTAPGKTPAGGEAPSAAIPVPLPVETVQPIPSPVEPLERTTEASTQSAPSSLRMAGKSTVATPGPNLPRSTAAQGDSGSIFVGNPAPADEKVQDVPRKNNDVSPAVGDARSEKNASEATVSKREATAAPVVNDPALKPSAQVEAQAPATPVAASVLSNATGSIQNHLSGTQNTQPAAANPYQRLDQSSAPAPVMLHASASRISVGIHDPSLGWVEVKTQAVAGQVSAALVAATSQTHQSLAAQLPSLTQFLADRQVPVGSVTVHQGMAGGDTSSASGQRHQQGTGGQGTSTAVEESSSAPVEIAETAPEGRPLSYISVRA